jgi:hypothetical protein
VITYRKKQEELAADLRRRRETHEIHAVLTLLASLYEDVKESLVTCQPDTCARLQGEAQAYKRLTNLLTRDPLAQIKE